MILTKNYLERLQRHQLLDLAEFVVVENFKHHSDNKLPIDYKNDVNAIYKEELKYYDDSVVFTVKNDTGSIVGAIRVLKWNYVDILPIQKIFGINPFLVLSKLNINDIYHVGRFAVCKDVSDFNLFKRLMVCVSTIICNHNGNIAFAECDSKLLRILNLLGIKTKIIGEPKIYLGSETIPIVMTYDGIINFYNTNKGLLEDAANNILEPFELTQIIKREPISYSA